MSALHTVSDTHLLPQLILRSAERDPQAAALRDGARALTYAELAGQVEALAHGLLALGLGRAERVGIWLDKRLETVVASFAAPAAGGVFVPINPILKAEQVGFIVRDCDVRVLITSRDRFATLGPVLAQCPSIRQVVLVDAPADAPADGWLRYADLLDAGRTRRARRIASSTPT